MTTKLPNSSEIVFYQWARKTAPAPKLASPVNSYSDKTFNFTEPFLDENGDVPTGGFLFAVQKANMWAELCWVSAGDLSADGKTATVVRGIDPGGLNFTTGSADFADSHDMDEAVFCAIPAHLPRLFQAAFQGEIATGGASFIIGTDASGTTTVKRSTGTGASAGMLRWSATNSKVEYSNDGTTWIAIDDTVASVLSKVSSNDTTPAYLENKVTAGANITITKKNPGANEYLEIATTLPSSVDTPSIYTPAYLTGGTSAESTYSNWLAVLNGSFRITIDGTLRNVTGINFTGVTSMADVATKIQTAIRAATSGSETVAWSTNKFIITSGNTTSTSAITVTSAVGSGTDISGAGTSNWMDCDVGTVTNAVLNTAAYDGYLTKIKNGKVDPNFIPTDITASASYISEILAPAGEAVNGSTTPQLVYLSDGTNGKTAGSFYKADADDTTNMALIPVGFITENASSVGTSYKIKTGYITGFTGLTAGATYYSSTTAGSVTTTATASSSQVVVGKAISSTELLTYSNIMSHGAAGHNQSGLFSAGGSNLTIYTGFKPKSIFFTMYMYAGGDTPAERFWDLIWDGSYVVGQEFTGSARSGWVYTSNLAANVLVAASGTNRAELALANITPSANGLVFSFTNTTRGGSGGSCQYQIGYQVFPY